MISSGLCGFDINCGMIFSVTNLQYDEVKDRVPELIKALFDAIPCGVGGKAKLHLTDEQLDAVMREGVKWCVNNDYGTQDDLEHTEEKGKMDGADPGLVSDLAKKRGKKQLGTLGAGNHFIELQKVDKVFDEEYAKQWGIREGQLVYMIHSGSRGLGHQVATDHLKLQEKAVEEFNIQLADNQLACAPVKSKQGQEYFKAMQCAANYAFANRHMMNHWMRQTMMQVLGMSEEELGAKMVYSLCHNIVKLEEYEINGGKQQCYVHRKGATRAFPDQPVLIPGSMGTSSWVLAGTQKAMEETFGSSAHGAGRVLSRKKAISTFKGKEVSEKMLAQGIVSKSTNWESMAEEAPGAYKDVDEVIETVHDLGICKKVARLVPVGVIKG
jgi:tRNA-splicing ligase RtcB (3'-phosphate/5'-hydroxy nucleic acid ligase)